MVLDFQSTLGNFVDSHRAGGILHPAASARRLNHSSLGGECAGRTHRRSDVRVVLTSLEADVKGGAYEGLLEKNAASVKGGARQYFTPRPLIRAIVDVMRPVPGQNIHDPACGTGGFLMIAHDYVSQHYDLDRDQKKHLKLHALSGNELVDSVARLCVMNLYLHGIGGDDCPMDGGVDSLAQKPSVAYDMVLTSPPFGKKSSITVINEEGDESKRRSPTSAMTSGPRPATSSSTSCSM